MDIDLSKNSCLTHATTVLSVGFRVDETWNALMMHEYSLVSHHPWNAVDFSGRCGRPYFGVMVQRSGNACCGPVV